MRIMKMEMISERRIMGREGGGEGLVWRCGERHRDLKSMGLDTFFFLIFTWCLIYKQVSKCLDRMDYF